MKSAKNIKSIEGYKWIVSDPDLLGGRPAIKGTRLSVSLILTCLSEGMSVEEIKKTYGDFPGSCISEVLKYASEVLDKFDVAA